MSDAASRDSNGREIRRGDWVRVLQAPLSIRGMPEETLRAFSNAIGKTFQVVAFAPSGDLELDMWDRGFPDTIWIESYCCVISRRPSKLSSKFLKRYGEMMGMQSNYQLERPWSHRGPRLTAAKRSVAGRSTKR